MCYGSIFAGHSRALQRVPMQAEGIKMLFPETYPAALGLTILTMICWGSWANTLKLCPGYRFQLFYWDYVLGMAAGAIFWWPQSMWQDWRLPSLSELDSRW